MPFGVWVRIPPPGPSLKGFTMTKILEEYCEYEIDDYPDICEDCPFLLSYTYQCHNETGIAYSCRLGYMHGSDTRDYPVNKKRWDFCKIEHDPRIYLPEEWEDIE